MQTTSQLLYAVFSASASVNLSAQPLPHHFCGIQVEPDCSVTLSLDGCVSNMFQLTGSISNQVMELFDLYPIEVSPNLQDWTPLALMLRTNNNPNPLLYLFTNTTGLNQCFYRTPTNHLLTAFPNPSGPYTVGSVDLEMVDPVRVSNPFTLRKSFMVTFWYPADPPAAGVLPAPMDDPMLAADTNLFISAGFDPQWGLVFPCLMGHRYSDVPVAKNGGRFPVVIYSHGLQGWRKMSSRRAEELASHGYIVVAPDHEDCWATQWPDGRYVRGSTSDSTVSSRLRDMQCILDELATYDVNDPLFAGRLDLDRIGVAGGSYGGMVVETCRSDTRVKCAALWDATNVQMDANGLQKPLLVGLGVSSYFYAQDLWLYNTATTNAVFIQLEGADHLTACDVGWTMQTPWGRAPAQVFDACVVWFFDTYLKGETPEFPESPVITEYMSK